MADRIDENVIELFPVGFRGEKLKTELIRVVERVDEVLAELTDELPPEEVQRLHHRFADLSDVIIFLRALVSA